MQLRENYSIIIVTHNMQQASRIADYTAFFHMGHVLEYDVTEKIFTTPQIKATEDYISGASDRQTVDPTIRQEENQDIGHPLKPNGKNASSPIMSQIIPQSHSQRLKSVPLDHGQSRELSPDLEYFQLGPHL